MVTNRWHGTCWWFPGDRKYEPMPIVKFQPSTREPRARSRFIAPKFGGRCVCCNGDALGRTQDYDPSVDRVRADAVTMPVCFACRKHALRSHSGTIVTVGLVYIGIVFVALGSAKLGDRPGDTFLWGTIVGAAALTAGAVMSALRANAREKRLVAEGHHAGLTFSVTDERPALITHNRELAEELVALNPGAELSLTRAERRRLPRARALGDVDREQL